MTAPMIETQRLTKRLGTTDVLRGLDLQVGAGEIYALLGPNGAGKTTTVRILATLTRADGGTARVAGADVREQRHLVRRRIALTGQYAALDQLQTGRENLRMMARLSGMRAEPARARSEQLLERFDLGPAAGRRVATYSGGMRRRLDLAASLVSRPSVIFLDEPTTGLDPRSRQDVWRVAADLAAHGTTVFLTTQYLEEADQLADRIAVLDAGRIVAEGAPATLKSEIGGLRLELVATNASAYAELCRRLGARAVDGAPESVTVAVAVDDDAFRIRATLDELDPERTLVARFAIRSVSLDDVFLALTGRGLPASNATTEENPDA
jgi:ABC-2 type transport system ATP-binding protein